MTDTPRGAGRPSLYRPEYDAQVIEFGRQGLSVVQMAAKFGVSRNSIYVWMETHPSFDDAMQLATTLAQAYWEEFGMGKLESPGFQGGTWFKIMGVRYRKDWKEVTGTELSGPDGAPVESVTRIERVIVDPAN